MAIFKVEGGRRLRGEITPQGAKNEALQILCATLLTQEKVIVHNVPQILDVIQLIELLQAMGVEVERLSEESYSFRAADIDPDYLRSDDYCRRASRLRGSVMLLGPMLARFGVGYMPKPGGDKIGRKQEIFVLFQPEFFIDALFESVRTFVVKLARENNIQRRFSRIASHPVISP